MLTKGNRVMSQSIGDNVVNHEPLEPYIGPRPFKRDKEDFLRFFGRDAETDEIVSLITAHRITLIYAQSGAGKTSIFNTQCTNSLENYGFEVLPIARVRVTTTSISNTKDKNNTNNNINSLSSLLPDSSNKIDNLYVYNALQSLCPEINSQKLLNLALFEFLDLYFPNQKDENGDNKPQVLIFDQLEELFNYYPDKWLDQQKEFFEQVADSLENNPLLQIVFIVREDHLAQFDPFKNILPEKLRPKFRLERLGRDESIAAVKGPIKDIIKDYSEEDKKKIDSEIKELVDDLLKIYVETPDGGSRPLEGEFVEPIQLQVVCRRWWKERKGEIKTSDKKSALDDRANVDKALQDFYEESIHDTIKQTKVKEKEIRNWFEEKLITSSGTRSIIHRDRDFTENLSNKVVDILENKYLIRREWRSGASWYELTHDRLIKPIKDSNKKWKSENEIKRKKKIIAIVTPAIALMIISITIFIYLSSINTNITGNEPWIISQSVNPLTNVLYIADNYNANTVSVIDGKTNKVTATIPVGKSPLTVRVNPITNVAYTINSNDNTVSVIDGKTNKVTATIPVGTNPRSIAVNHKTDNVYIVNSNANTVSVIDGKTNKVTATIPVGTNPTNIAVNPVTDKAYVPNYYNNTVSVIDGKTNVVTATIPIGNKPNGIAVNSVDNIAFVSNYYNNTVSVIDGKTNVVTATIPVGNKPSNIAVNPVTDKAYVANLGDNTISVIDGKTNKVTATIHKIKLIHNIISVGKDPAGIAVNPVTDKAYAANLFDNTVSVIDGKTNVMTATIPIGNKLKGTTASLMIFGSIQNSIAVNPVDNIAFVSNYYNNTVSVIDGKTKVVTATIPVGNKPNNIAVNPVTNKAYAANLFDNTVSVIDGKTNKVTATIPVGNVSSNIAVNPVTDKAYVTNLFDNTVSVIDGKTNVVIVIIPVDKDPVGIAVNPVTNKAYVANYKDNTVSVIDGKTNVVTATIPVGNKPNNIAVNHVTDKAYVTNLSDNTVSVIDGKTNSVIDIK
jgi:YVTN family beta-propeller protein